MSAVAYTVIATLPDEGLASEYIGWLEEGHIDEVIRAGAHSAAVVRIIDPPSPIQVETRYVFSNPGAFERYVREAAPGLRAAGVKRFPEARGISFQRRVGTIL